MQTETFVLPRHWACALLYGDADGFDPNEESAFNKFTDWMLDKYNSCFCIDVIDYEVGDFRHYHDATEFNALPCEVATFVFDVTQQPQRITPRSNHHV